MTERLHHDWLAWLLVVGTALSLIGPLNLLFDVGSPFGDYIAFQRAAADYPEVDGNTPSWWAAPRLGLLPHGNMLISVNGQPHATAAREEFARAFEGGEVVAVTTLRDGEMIIVDVPVARFTLSDFVDLRLPDLITAFVLWTSAFIVYTARPDDSANRAFALAMSVAGYSRIMYVHTVFFDGIAIASELQLQFWLSLLGPCIVLLAVRFPTTWEHRLAKPLLFVVGALGVLSFLLTLYSRMDSMPQAARAQAAQLAFYLVLLLLYFGVAALMVRLVIWGIHSRHSKRDRRIAAILIVGLALSLPPMIASGLNLLITGQGSTFYFINGLDLRYMLLFVPLAFAFVLLRYQALKSPSPLFVFLMVVTISALTAAVLAWVWGLIRPQAPYQEISPPFFAIFLAALFTGVFWTFVARRRQFLGRSLFWDHYSSNSVREFGRRVSAGLDVSRTPESIASAVVEVFELDQCAVWLLDPNADQLTLAAHYGTMKSELPATVDMAGRSLPGTSYPFRPSLVSDPAAPWSATAPESSHIDVVVPLSLESHILGVMGLGPRWDEDIFDNRNLDIFEIVGQQATLLLDVTQHVQQLQRVPARLADAQEKERLWLARELHDTVQQMLGRLPFYLAISRDSFARNPAKAVKYIELSIDDVVEAAQIVRQIRHNLGPSQLAQGLTPALATLVATFERRTGITTTVTLDPALDQSTNMETRLAVYRVVQQALNNVEKHAAATQVAINCTVGKEQVCFTVGDNGRGSSERERQAARVQGSFGMESMAARLVAVGGSFDVVSSPGIGLEVRGCVPVASPPSPDTTANGRQQATAEEAAV